MGNAKQNTNQKKNPTNHPNRKHISYGPYQQKGFNWSGEKCQKYMIKALELDSFPRRLFLLTPAGDGGAVSLSQHCSHQVGEGRWGRVVVLLLSTQAFGDLPPSAPSPSFLSLLDPPPYACSLWSSTSTPSPQTSFQPLLLCSAPPATPGLPPFSEAPGHLTPALSRAWRCRRAGSRGLPTLAGLGFPDVSAGFHLPQLLCFLKFYNFLLAVEVFTLSLFLRVCAPFLHLLSF